MVSVNKVILVVEPYMPGLPKPSDLAKLVTTMQENPHGTLALVSLTAMIVLAVVVVVR